MRKVKFSSGGYYYDFETNTLHMTHRFSMKASDMESHEFEVYEKYATHFPNLKIRVEAPKRRKSPYITYDKMAVYIAFQSNAVELMKQFKAVKEESRSQKNPRKFVDDWFRNTFPDFGKYPLAS
ncbi:MAG: hypothetical protein IKT52_03475 [Oscillospiraceae bacterium]|nr:hypothetical protein [Oscillospiraceae bacterium]